ncbi:MAG: DUF1761 domain-containing protein [Rhodobacteraceae bacterium]|jgi:Protein of unknown function (DUF1761)|nr:DUF1761 domain-containing protein [Paracoccaceae bacterium]
MEYLNVVAAAVAAFAFGALWYTLMSKPWVKAAGLAVDAAGRPQGNGSALPFVIGLVAMLVVAGTMRHLFAFAGIDTLGEGVSTGAGVGAFFISAWVGMNYSFSMRPLALWLIDTVNAVAGCAIMGAVLVAF